MCQGVVIGLLLGHPIPFPQLVTRPSYQKAVSSTLPVSSSLSSPRTLVWLAPRTSLFSSTPHRTTAIPGAPPPPTSPHLPRTPASQPASQQLQLSGLGSGCGFGGQTRNLACDRPHGRSNTTDRTQTTTTQRNDEAAERTELPPDTNPAYNKIHHPSTQLAFPLRVCVCVCVWLATVLLE